MASYLQVEHISKSYGDKILLNNISFNINQGDKIALIAPNGSGKSTLLSILAGKDSSDMGGEIKFMKDITIAYLEQDYDFDKEIINVTIDTRRDGFGQRDIVHATCTSIIVDEATKGTSYKLSDCNPKIEDNVILFVEE